jgi:CPA1 family monovalent cation:H+ antiporter
VNDGSGLVALRFTLALTLTGTTPSVAAGIGTLAYLVAMGILIGLAVGFAVNRIQRSVSDSSIEITISIITPFVAYLSAEAANCSGVLATLACGMYLARSRDVYSAQARIEGAAVWNTLDFVLNGLVFLLLGLQLPQILAEIRGVTTGQLIAYGALFSAFVIALRMGCVYPGLRLGGHTRQSAFLVGWAGMRGVLALAAALSLPEQFPQRSMIIFLTFSVIFATLVLQGLSMPVLIRNLGLARVAAIENEMDMARRYMTERALESLSQMRSEWGGKDLDVLMQAERFYRSRLTTKELGPLAREEARLLKALKKRLREAERSAAYQLRDEEKIDDGVLRSLQYEIDLRDATEQS